VTTPQKKKSSETSVRVPITPQDVHNLQKLTAGVAVGAELFTRMGTALSSMARVMSPLLRATMTTLAEDRYWSSFDTNYWLIRDDSLMPVERVKGYDGNPDPVCYNCEHRLTDHTLPTVDMPPGWLNEIRRDGGKIPCLKGSCPCYYFEPSYVVEELVYE
jgi:hypothetical protein